MAVTVNRYIEGLAGAASLISAAGEDHFAAELLDVLEPAVHVDHIVVFTFSFDGKPGWLLTYGSVPNNYAVRLAEQYVGSYFELDPGFQNVLDFQTDQPPQVSGFDRNKVNSQRYWETFYKNSSLIDKISILHSHDRLKYLTNYYRATGSAPFSVADKTNMRRIAPLLTSAVSLHVDHLKDTASGLSLRDSSQNIETAADIPSVDDVNPFDSLSERERDICRLILIGFSTEAMALDLGLSVNTVKTYRRRAYKKLGIISANELHWKFHMRRPTG
ncbi:MAG: helix-turn-helix transcriptional regulator [Fimbriimonadaceae bacterium]|nr:helix-turn-helix transcriptional regulator [Alphaproteobacteria bacterium]